ncbi:double-strand break repair helicase AddA [Xinfangfangia sp. CPCC 101601]|uniref:DNA 3'-5' helicase n=1 Tax=Pseudogemmobacter lacusdianii TaxID=3069608 RepID=A0ABU0VTY5_9RHOB|nr:double-strand break repair helicase AddA [Xinfangfangia sp. CPCC 101601]MDQ2065196.1 double-strand break repair helicase AddA [Xinfangfangia sp. CPCC 101601]
MNEASRNQIVAADPGANTWLVANAGSGKTRVLTDRVARLLLGGAEPLSILCLTYTKAAAAEMQNRLFKTLGSWAMATDAELQHSLAQLGEAEGLTPLKLAQARQLFAKAIETPGGIRIQTIHSFCAALLRRFPLEAGVSPGFTEIDDRSALLLREEILEDLALSHDAPALERLMALGGDLAKLLPVIISSRADFMTAPEGDALRDAISVPPGLDEETLLASVFLGGEGELLADLAPLLLTGGSNDSKAGRKIAALLPLQPSMATLAVLEGLFISGPETKNPLAAKVGSFPTKGMQKTAAAYMDRLDALMLRVEAARAGRIALNLLRRTEALHRFARAFLARYHAAKERRGWLDFDDLITLATELLTDPSLSAWVLYRLDGGISHVLVDEAQDTSPAQWRLIQLLTSEFTAGEGSHDDPRTLFVVGDKKQSIYSFQGADVTAFDAMRDRFRLAFEEAGLALNERPLIHSFRSSPAILRLVDLCFPPERQAAMGGAVEHVAFHGDLPGRVDFWPVVTPPEAEAAGEWYKPEDRTGQESADVQLARQISIEIRQMIDRGEQILDRGQRRAVHEGDFLILVRRRAALFQEVIRACKMQGLQIAGADRLVLSDELAVKDVLALLRFLDTPEDDLSLAAALRSPLLGLSEDGLFRLAHGRKGFLWERLRDAEGLDEIRAVLDDLRKQAEFLRPFELIDRILTRHDGRRKLLGRLGEEAADGLDELMSQALAFEQVDVPGLTGFLVWMDSGKVVAKRQAESEGHRIRVMTVHGAKGLEAPIVILPDTGDRRAPNEDPVVVPEAAPPLWLAPKDEATAMEREANEARKAVREAESLRLLYVAVTRARGWLIVAASGKAGEGSWYGMLLEAAKSLPLQPYLDGRMRHEMGEWVAPQVKPVAGTELATLPGWALQAVAPGPEALQEFSPSKLGGVKTLPGEAAGDPDALGRGVLLHEFLERFPSLAAEDRAMLGEVSPELAAVAEALIAKPDLAEIFGPETLAEVGFAMEWNGGILSGSIDRMVIGPERLLVVDYKSNQQVPQSALDVPEGYLRQLGAYAHAAEALYPGRRIEVAILWTESQSLMAIDRDIVRLALERSAISSGAAALHLDDAEAAT